LQDKVLVVEDSITFRNFLTNQLTKSGYKVVSTTTLAESEQLLNREQDFLCAVLDYCLPDSPDGEIIELAVSKNQRAIVLTATFRQDAREQMINRGVLDYIPKDSASSVNDLLIMIDRLASNRKHHALIVDDSQLVRKHLKQLLEHQYITTSEAKDGVEALNILNQNNNISFVITDHDMPNKDGISLTRDIRQISDRHTLPILGLSGSEDRTMTARFIKAGANDFLYKPFNQEELYCRIHSLLGMKEANDKLHKMANQDYLTGLWNRRYFFSQSGQNYSGSNIAMIDIDLFKNINDTYGHDAGDLVIKRIASVLQMHFENSCVARFGGEEFCILHRGTFDSFLTTLEKMRSRIEKMSIHYGNNNIQTTVSIGATQASLTLDAQIKTADALLYQAKSLGRNQLAHD
jgi:diguanylate cyclase (GGDEF)-like protein